MTAPTADAPRTPPRALIRTFWVAAPGRISVSAAAGSASRDPEAGRKFGMLRLDTIGRTSGQPRIDDRRLLRGRAEPRHAGDERLGRRRPGVVAEPPGASDTIVELTDGPRAVRARAAVGEERDRLWAGFRDFPGWGDDIDALAARRAIDTRRGRARAARDCRQLQRLKGRTHESCCASSRGASCGRP